MLTHACSYYYVPSAQRLAGCGFCSNKYGNLVFRITCIGDANNTDVPRVEWVVRSNRSLEGVHSTPIRHFQADAQDRLPGPFSDMLGSR